MPLLSILNANYLVKNDYAIDATMWVYTDKDQAYAETIAGNLNTKYSNTLSSIQDLSDDSYIVTSALSIQAAIDAASNGDKNWLPKYHNNAGGNAMISPAIGKPTIASLSFGASPGAGW